MAIEYQKIKKILIINLAFIGDVLLSTPIARALREKYPTAIIDMMVIPLTEPIARGNPFINNVIVYDKKGRHKKIIELWNLIKSVRNEKYDLSVSANFAPRGAMLAWAAGIKYRLGYDAQHGSYFLTHPANSHRPVIRHESENHLDVLKPLGIKTKDTSLAFKVNLNDIKSMKEKTKIVADKPNVIVCPFGSYYQKSWTESGYAELINTISNFADCYLIGSKNEEARLEKINSLSSNRGKVLAGNLTLGEIAALIKSSTVVVTVDTGPMHLANALGIPVIALFGPTDPITWGPRGRSDIVIKAEAECSPCWGKKECPQTRCMEQIDTNKVIEATMRFLRK